MKGIKIGLFINFDSDLFVGIPVNNIRILNRQDQYEFYTDIVCRAEGSPDPSYSWYNENGNV